MQKSACIFFEVCYNEGRADNPPCLLYFDVLNKLNSVDLAAEDVFEEAKGYGQHNQAGDEDASDNREHGFLEV